jgi:hypothetical protein
MLYPLALASERAFSGKMQGNSGIDADRKLARRAPGARVGRRRWGLDGRTYMSRRLHAVMADLAHQYGIVLDISDAILRRAGELTIAAEQARLALIRHEPGISIDHLLRLEGLASRACRDLATRAKAAPSTQPTVEQYLEQLQADSEAVP